MSFYPLPTALFFKNLKKMFMTTAIKLFVFIIAAEMSIMVLFSYFELDLILSPLQLTLADGALLTLLIAAPFQAWMVKSGMDAIKGSQDRLNVLASAVKYAGDGIMITNRCGKIEYINQALRDILLCESEDVIGKPVSTIDAAMGSAIWRRRFMHAIHRDHVWHDEQWGLRSNGEKYLAKVTVTPIWMQDGGGISNFITIVRDQTAHHALEMKYHQAQKMEAVGTLVGGIAHDFNNMLSSLTGHIYMTKAQLKQMPSALIEANKIFSRLSQMEALAMHATEMIQQLMTFARKDNVEKTVLALPSFMKEALKLAAVSLPANIHFQQTIHQGRLTVFANGTQLQQALMNLINNARDAVSGVSQPKISVDVDQVDASHASLYAQGAPAGTYVEICVADNGCGIDEDYITRVMEPFFTTKEVGKGTGLGLAMVYGIVVKEHQGYIDINSRVGTGTSIHLFLPLTDCSRIDVIQTAQIYSGFGETILLVDDQQDVRETCREVLESLGYAVLEACDGIEALDIYARHTGLIAAVVSDVVMPRMQGGELAVRIKQQNSRLPVILVSGYHKDDVLDDSVYQYVDTMLAKPFSIASLSYALHRLLYESKSACGLEATGQLNLCWSEAVPE